MLITSGLIIATFIWLLLAPVTLVINTLESRYYLGFQGLARVNWQPEDWSFQIKLPLYSFRVDPWKSSPGKKQMPSRKSKKGNKSRRKPSLGFKKGILLARDIWSSFEVRVFKLEVDTGDYTMNAKLVPLMLFLSRGQNQLTTNYQGVCSLHLEIENRLIRVVKPLVRHLIFK